MTKKITIAKVNSAFGIKGEVKMIIYSNEPQKIEQYQLFDQNDQVLKVRISNKNKTIIGTASGNPILIVKIEGIDDRNAAEKICGTEIFTLRQNLDETAEDEFYYADLIDLDVIDEASQKIGKVINVFDNGGCGVVEIEFANADLKKLFGSIDNFAFSNAIFPEVNLVKGFIRIVNCVS
jgi:16S rRNA processing protein RimM